MIKYIRESLSLDLRLLQCAPLHFYSKMELIIKKYLYFILLSFHFDKGKSRGRFLGETVYFPNKFGYLSIQRILVDCAFLKNNLPSDLSYIDVGAHSGEFSFFARKCLGAKEVVSFEPDPETYRLLRKNHYGRSHNHAVSNENSVAILYRSSISSQLNTLIPPNKDSELSYKETQRVSCVRLDDYLHEQYPSKKFQVLKIDVEGAEHLVLSGGIQMARSVNYIIMELSLEPALGTTVMKFLSYIEKELPGFQLFALNSYTMGDRSIDIILKKL